MTRNLRNRRGTPDAHAVRTIGLTVGAAVLITANAAGTARAQSTSEMLQLSTAVADAVGELRLAASAQRAAAQLNDRAAIPQTKLEEAQIRRETAELKLRLLRELLASERQIQRIRRKELEELHRAGVGDVSRTDVELLTYRLALLERLHEAIEDGLVKAERQARDEASAAAGKFSGRIVVDGSVPDLPPGVAEKRRFVAAGLMFDLPLPPAAGPQQSLDVARLGKDAAGSE